MSMFYELMMRKKEQIMYATIKGTLTESPEGVFSGFSSSNYLNLQENIIYTNNFEMLFKITTGTSGTTQQIFEGSSSNIGLTIFISSDNKLFVSAGNGSWIVNTSGTTILSTNTTYYVKFSYKNNVYKLELSTDNINWNTEISVANSSVLTSTGDKSIGYSTRFNSRVFTGSIDLNQSYIKIDNTKYNLQAVVGYTVVGSPTIVDGVVSGFSSSNYLTLPDVDFSSNFESQVAFKINTYSPCGIFCLNSYDYKGWHCIGSNILAFSLHITNGSDTKFARLQFTVSTNTDYVANAKRNGNNVVCSLYSNGTLVSQQTLTIDEGYSIIEGVGYNIGKNAVGYFDGSIDLNETYIKINNKLWFNGQEG